MQTVLITGAASGIGRDTARLFAAAGWQCVLVDHNERALHQLGESLPSPASAAHVLRTIDLTDTRQIASLREGTPALANSRAVSRPMPEAAPVIKTVCICGPARVRCWSA